MTRVEARRAAGGAGASPSRVRSTRPFWVACPSQAATALRTTSETCAYSRLRLDRAGVELDELEKVVDQADERADRVAHLRRRSGASSRGRRRRRSSIASAIALSPASGVRRSCETAAIEVAALGLDRAFALDSELSSVRGHLVERVGRARRARGRRRRGPARAVRSPSAMRRAESERRSTAVVDGAGRGQAEPRPAAAA